MTDMADEPLRARLIAGLRSKLEKQETELILAYADNALLRDEIKELRGQLEGTEETIRQTNKMLNKQVGGY